MGRVSYRFLATPLTTQPSPQPGFLTGWDTGGTNSLLEPAVNFNECGRTYQDRSYTFTVQARPIGLAPDIYNLNVKGKRGRLLQEDVA